MKDCLNRNRARGGFTILELLIVVAIIAIIATLATGAAIKAMKQSRERRVEVMANGLEIALANYRAQENEWPFDLSDCVQDFNDRTRYWIHGKYNVNAFKKLMHGGGGSSKTVYLDAGAYLVTAQGARMTLKAALDQKKSEIAIGYPLPSNTDRFCHYCLCYNPLTDTVKVVRQDQGHQNAGGGGFACPEWTPVK